jgi:hypothetical protein
MGWFYVSLFFSSGIIVVYHRVYFGYVRQDEDESGRDFVLFGGESF